MPICYVEGEVLKMRPMYYYIIDDNDQPVPCEDVLEWGRWMKSNERAVAKTKFAGGIVSTVFLGLDHNFGDRGAPVLWETMIFGGPHDGYQDRYTSLKNARAGHKRAILLAMGDS